MVLLVLIDPRLRANELVGTDLVQAIPLVAAAALGHLIIGDAELDLGLAGTVLICAHLREALGPRRAGLRWALALLLLGSGLALWKAPSTLVLGVCLALTAVGVVTDQVQRAGRRHQVEACGHALHAPPSTVPIARSPPVGEIAGVNVARRRGRPGALHRSASKLSRMID